MFPKDKSLIDCNQNDQNQNINQNDIYLSENEE